MILVTGASGNVGSQVMGALIRQGQQVRAMYRSEKDAMNPPGGVSTAIADFADSQSLGRALQGIEKVFIVCGPVPQLVELESNAVAACKKAGVRHVVLGSALGAGTFNASFPAWHRKVEETLKRSGIPYTIVRPNSFMQNLVAFYAPTIRAQGAFYASMGKARVSLVDVRDVGDFVAAVLVNPGHEGATYELNGPEAVTYDEVAERISKITGRAARYVDLPPAQLKQAMLGTGMPEWQADALLELQRYYTEGGGAEVDETFKRAVGRDSRRLNQFLQEFATEFKQEAKSA